MNKTNLNHYLNEKKITVKELAAMTGVSQRLLNNFRHECPPTLNLMTIIKIYEGTKRKYGVGLTPWEYIDGLINFNKEIYNVRGHT
jgi:DNA-binding Xre family transcriptional regulator